MARFGSRSVVIPGGSFGARVNSRGFDVSGIAMYPITDAAAVFTRVGAFNGETKTLSNSTGSVMIFSSVKEET